MKNITDWNCTALDPDHRQFSHAQEFVGVNAIHGDFMQDLDELKNYEIITFNKVLEHVTNPIEMLRKAKGLLALGGFVYIELPMALWLKRIHFNAKILQWHLRFQISHL